MNTEKKFIPYSFDKVSENEMITRSEKYYHFLEKRRTIRTFSPQPVPKAVIEDVIRAAGTAPSGAHKQPYTFCVIGQSEIRKEIRKAAEEEEYINYHGRMSDEWLKDLEPFETDWHKPFIEEAPWIIVVFKKIYDLEENEKKKNYYVSESVGIAAGFLLTAIHHAGLAALTHTPSPMNFLEKILNRPSNEKAYLLIPVGYPADDTLVPNIIRKPLEEISVWY